MEKEDRMLVQRTNEQTPNTPLFRNLGRDFIMPWFSDQVARQYIRVSEKKYPDGYKRAIVTTKHGDVVAHPGDIISYDEKEGLIVAACSLDVDLADVKMLGKAGKK